jgi:site-specific recombinase XerD
MNSPKIVYRPQKGGYVRTPAEEKIRQEQFDKFIEMKEKEANKECPKCSKKFSYSNWAKHVNKCDGESRQEMIDKEKAELLKKNLKLERKISKLLKENKALRFQLGNKQEDFLMMSDLVKNKCANTRSSYQYHWDKYLDWCETEEIQPSEKKSIIDYFATLIRPVFTVRRKMKPSSLNTIRSVFLTGFKHIFNKNIQALLPRQKTQSLKVKPKYQMSNEEIFEFLKTLKLKIRDFLVYFILTFSGCRVHSLAMLKGKDYKNMTLDMHDYKTNQEIPFSFSNDAVGNMMTDYVTNQNPEEFLFYSPSGNSFYTCDVYEAVKKRGKFVSQILRIQLKNSIVFKHVSRNDFCVSPNMFRKTKAMTEFQRSINYALEETRNQLIRRRALKQL